MAFANNEQCAKLMIYGLVLYVSLSSLLAFSNADSSSELVPTTRRLLPFQQKEIMIVNRLSSRATINVHCKSTEDDLGLQHIRYPYGWSFRFKVNWKGTTKFRCHFTWRGGGDHWFTIFKDGRDHCDFCSWTIVDNEPKPLVRQRHWKGAVRREDYFDWDK